VPQPVLRPAERKTRLGVIYFGSTSPRCTRRWRCWRPKGIRSTPCAARLPVHDERGEFIAEHEQVFVVEQNRDAQMRSLLVNELDIDPARLVKVLHYDGTPITARFITGAISAHVAQKQVPRAGAVA
jgi:2-oxoglutarate ferredoxin oxidoreductase subunit alpha